MYLPLGKITGKEFLHLKNQWFKSSSAEEKLYKRNSNEAFRKLVFCTE